MESNELIFTVANFNNGQCLAVPFTYEKGKMTRFHLAYCLYKTAYDINPKVLSWFSDIYDELLENIYKGESGFLELDSNKGDNLYNIPFGYDGVRMHMTFTDLVWSNNNQTYAFDANTLLEIPYWSYNGKIKIYDNELFNTDGFEEHIIMTLLKKMNARDAYHEDYSRRYQNVKDHLMPFEDGLTFYVFGHKIQYGYIRTIEELFEKLPNWKEREND